MAKWTLPEDPKRSKEDELLVEYNHVLIYSLTWVIVFAGVVGFILF